MSEQGEEQPSRNRRQSDAALLRLSEAVSELSDQLGAYRAELDRRPVGAELEYKRRTVVLALLGIIFFTVHTMDAHVEYCGPGARSEDVIQAFLDHKPIDELRRVGRLPRPAYCDVLYPFHDSHDPGHHERRSLQTAGWAIYAALAAALLWWWQRPLKTLKREETENGLHPPGSGGGDHLEGG